jgi:hypothetical protein
MALKRIQISYWVTVLLTVSGLCIGLSYNSLPDRIPVYINHPMSEGGFGQNRSYGKFWYSSVLSKSPSFGLSGEPGIFLPGKTPC